ncbi:MAG: hypothetical protein OEY15_14390, partial [Myxococcales bacterium]|nr:hypothetical protein [Myxococcales bacterium]
QLAFRKQGLARKTDPEPRGAGQDQYRRAQACRTGRASLSPGDPTATGSPLLAPGALHCTP